MLADIHFHRLSDDALSNCVVKTPKRAGNGQAGDGMAFPRLFVGNDAFGHSTDFVDIHIGDSRRDALPCFLEVFRSFPVEPGVGRIRQEIEADPQTADADRRGTRLQKGGRKGFLSKDKETKAHNRTNNAEKEPKGPEPSVYFRDAIQALSCRFFEKRGCMPPFISNSTLLYHHKSYMESVETEREPLFQREGLSREERLYLSMMDARQN